MPCGEIWNVVLSNSKASDQVCFADIGFRSAFAWQGAVFTGKAKDRDSVHLACFFCIPFILPRQQI